MIIDSIVNDYVMKKYFFLTKDIINHTWLHSPITT